MEAALHPTRSLRRAWAVLARAPVVLWMAGLGVLLCERSADFLRDNFSRDFWLGLADQYPMLLTGVPEWAFESQAHVWAPGVVLLLLLLLLVRSIVEAGAITTHRRVIESGHADLGVLLQGVRWAPGLFAYHMMGWGLVLGSLALACLPGILMVGLGIRTGGPEIVILGAGLVIVLIFPVWLWISLGLYLGSRVLVLEDCSPLEALERSFVLASGERTALFVFRFVCLCFKLLGILVGLAACGVGVFVTWPLFRAVSDAALSEAYLIGVRVDSRPWRMLLELGEE